MTQHSHGAWWLIGRFGAFRSKGRWFDSRSSCHVGTLGKSFTRSTVACGASPLPKRFGVKFRHSIRAVSGAPLSSRGVQYVHWVKVGGNEIHIKYVKSR